MSQEIVQALLKKIPTVHREGILWEAAREYMRGNISASELEEIEHSTAPHSRHAWLHQDEKPVGENHVSH